MKVTATYEFDVPDELVKKSIDEKCIMDDPDIVKVVRCKDCKHRNGGCQYTHGRNADDDDWFCADGERSEDREESC